MSWDGDKNEWLNKGGVPTPGVRQYNPNPAVCCEACVFGRGPHSDWCKRGAASGNLAGVTDAAGRAAAGMVLRAVEEVIDLWTAGRARSSADERRNVAARLNELESCFMLQVREGFHVSAQLDKICAFRRALGQFG